nr:glycosyltransferase [uncultured Niameybacter sp.]
MKKKCDIIIPVYNSADWVELCVEAAVKSDISNIIQKIIIVDDCSNVETKETLLKLAKKYNLLEIITNESNLGFVKTCNKGMKQSKADYIMLLNSDCLLAEDTTSKLINHLIKNRKVGLICPLSNNAANISIPIPLGLNYIQYDKLLGKKFPGQNFNACTIVGNCMIITKECYEAVGGLDEAYGMGYGEETDYQFKAQEKGFSALVAIDTYVFHKSQMSFGDNEVLSERKQKNLNLFLTRWGYEYQECLKEYEKNDPVKYVLEMLTEGDHVQAKGYKSKVFDMEYNSRVKDIDNKYMVSEISIQQSKHRVNKFKILSQKALDVYKQEGIGMMLKRSAWYLLGKDAFPEKNITPNNRMNVLPNTEKICSFKDIIFITNNNCTHNISEIMEALSFNGLYSDVISINKMSTAFLKCYRGVIFVDCEMSEEITLFIEKAYELNKSIFIYSTEKNRLYLNRYKDIGEKISGVILDSKINNELVKDKFKNIYTLEYIDENSQIKEEITLNGYKLVKFIKQNLKQNIAFILPSIFSCGGVNVVIKHCQILKQEGYDVFIINMSEPEDSCFSDGEEILVISEIRTQMVGSIDKVVATMWLTNNYIDTLTNYNERYYLVQGFETAFYEKDDIQNRGAANATYSVDKYKYITVSQWCKNWLENDFERNTYLARNGLNVSQFQFKKREFNNKITILIEGDPGSFYKNIDESFRITNKLDPAKFEIVFLSNNAYPKQWYRVDKFYHKLGYNEVVKVYQEAHILLKSSILESFSYPPLEMMCTGGLVVAVQNGGNSEFLKHGENSLIYEKGNIEDAINKINELVEDKLLREKLIDNGLKTANERSWEKLRKEIIEAYQ